MKINKGTGFVCIKKVKMDTKEIAYEKGYIYPSEEDGCITDEDGNKDHGWTNKSIFKKYFVELK
jgi:hypothetical protein